MKLETRFIGTNKIASTSSIFSGCRVAESNIGEKVTIGDFSRVEYSTLYENSRIDRNNYCYKSSVGKYSYTGMNCVVVGAKIGAFCSLSWNLSIGGADHDYSRMTQHSFLYNDRDSLRPENLPAAYDRFSKPVEIGNDVWIAANVTVTRGVKIDNGAVIAANSVVTKDVPAYAIVAGAPAKVIKYRFEQDIIDRLQALKWWQLSSEQIKQHYGIISEAPTLKSLELLESVIKSAQNR